jgi:hypothetical protein
MFSKVVSLQAMPQVARPLGGVRGLWNPQSWGGGVTNFQPHEAQKLSCGGKLIFDEIVLFHRVVAPNRLEKKVDHTKWTTLSGPISSANTYH